MSHHQQYTPEVHEEPDEWHRHTADEGPPQEEHAGKPNNFLLALTFLFSLAFVAATILASFLYFQVHMTGIRQKRMESTVLSQDYVKYRDAAMASRDDFSFPTAEMGRSGRALLPHDQAAERVIARYRSAGGTKQ